MIKVWILLSLALFKQVGWCASPKDSFRLVGAWVSTGRSHDIQSWSLDELTRMRRTSSREKDPQTKKLVKWEGVLLYTLVEAMLNQLPLDNRAQVDLVILKGATGQRALIPRSLLGKYPILLALQGDSHSLASLSDRGPIYSVMPWSSKSKILSEDLPLEQFFIPGISKIELTSYRDQYSSLFLRRRTDPSAVRGEKLFVQNCVSCHAPRIVLPKEGIFPEEQAKKLEFKGHPEATGVIKLNERDRRAIVRYLEAHRMENASSVSLSRQ